MMKSGEERQAHRRFVLALQHEPMACSKPGCREHLDVVDLSQQSDRIKTYEARCARCGWQERITGKEELQPVWDDASLLMMADEHLMHQQPLCPFDDTPVVFTSLPNPRRKARYRLSCYYCGRQTTMAWPPPEAKR